MQPLREGMKITYAWIAEQVRLKYVIGK
jgi:hypothetical protein